MDIEMKYEDALTMYKNNSKGFFEYFKQMFPNFNLYTFSLGWVESKEYICKFRGVNGDLIIHWSED